MIGSGSGYCQAPAPVRGGVPRIKPQALNNASMHRGSQVDVLFHNYGKMGPEPRLGFRKVISVFFISLFQ